MVAINFKPEFVPQILARRKTHSVRKSNRCKPGDALQLYTGMRTKDCQKICDTTCVAVVTCKIEKKELVVVNGGKTYHAIPNLKGIPTLSDFAIRDGFGGWDELVSFFERTHGLPFVGFIICWDWERLENINESLKKEMKNE